MEVAGEFLVMAATLMWMKSQMLLPRAEPIDEEGDDPSTQEELIERLLRYQAVKEAAKDLRRREDSGLLQVERILSGIDGIAIVYLHTQDVIRHRLVKDIILAYETGVDDGGAVDA